MPHVIAAPERMTSAATDLATIGSDLGADHAAAVRTVAVMPAGADEVSSSIAHLFSRYAQGYQALAGQAAALHDQFVQHLSAGAGSYASTEAANVSLTDFLSRLQLLITTEVTTLPPQQALLFVLALPIEIPTFLYLYLVLNSLPPSFLPLDF